MRKVAIIGAGLTKFMRRAKETPKELAYYAAKAALDSCNLTINDIECVVLGSAPDAFDGIHMKGEYLIDGSLAVNKPFMRCAVGGATGVFAVIHGFYHIACGRFDTCLVVCEEKMSSCQPHPQTALVTIFDPVLERPLYPNSLWIFALEMTAYMNRYGFTHRDIAQVVVKNKKNAVDHPATQTPEEVTLDEVLNSEVLAYPVHRLDVSPPSDGAAAIVLASEDKAKELTDKPVWVAGIGWCLDTSYWTNRDLSYPVYVEHSARMAYKMAGIENPKEEIHIVEPYDPFDYKELHHLEGLLLCDKGKAPEFVASGEATREGVLPVCPSGGLLGVGNPISAAGLMKVIEIFWQLRGEAGNRQVKRDVRCGLVQGWGGLMQVSAVVVLKR